MNRRDLFKMFIGGAAAVVAAPTLAVKPVIRLPTNCDLFKPVIRLPTNCDLASSSLRWAVESAGWVNPTSGYVLRVHPRMGPRAECVLRDEFGDEWRAHLVLDPMLTDEDAWSVEGSHSIVYSLGA